MSSVHDSSLPRHAGRAALISQARVLRRFCAAAVLTLSTLIISACAQSNSSGAVTSSTPGAQTLTSAAGTYEVTFVTTPSSIPMNESFEVRGCVRTVNGQSASKVALMVDAAMPEHQHGMNTKPRVEVSADNCFHVDGMLFHMPGRWELYFDITQDGITERAQTEVNLE